jgi:LEA14-like dessication related protein
MRRAVILSVAAVVVGCATLGKQAFKQPAVELRDVRVVGIGVTGGELEISLAVKNPNHYRIDANHLNYRLLVSDTIPVANGSLDNRSTVQADDSTLVKIPIGFTYAGLGAAGRQLMNTGVVNYKVTGDFMVESAIGSFNVPFSTTGRYSTGRR